MPAKTRTPAKSAAAAPAAAAPAPRDNGQPRFVNAVRLTVRIFEAEARVAASGQTWARARASVSMGKDADGNYRPALWLTVKAFTRDGDASVPSDLGSFEKGDLVTVTGRLAYEEFTSADGDKKGSLLLIAQRVEPLVLDDAPEASDEDEPF